MYEKEKHWYVQSHVYSARERVKWLLSNAVLKEGMDLKNWRRQEEAKLCQMGTD